MDLIVARCADGGIGKLDRVLHKMREDSIYLNFMAEKASALIVGRKTANSIPKKWLDKSIILSRDNPIVTIENIIANREDYYDCIVFGGAEIYNELVDYCDRAYVTQYTFSKPADTFFTYDFSWWEVDKVVYIAEEVSIVEYINPKYSKPK